MARCSRITPIFAVLGFMTSVFFFQPVSIAADPLLEQISPALDQARKAYKEGNLDEAVRLVQKALDSGKLASSEKVDAYKLLGTCLATLGRQSEAVQAFSRMLVLSPDEVIPENSSEEVTAAYQRAKTMQDTEKAESSAAAVEIRHQSPGAVLSGQTAKLVAEVTGLPEGASVTLYYAKGPDSPFVPILMQEVERGKWTAEIPTLQFVEKEKEHEINYYIEVTDEADDVLASAGTEDSPLGFRVVAPVPVEQEPPVWKKWWFWTAVGGGVVVGVTLGVVLGLTLGGRDTGNADVQIDLQP